MTLPPFTNITQNLSTVLELAEREAARRHAIYLDVEHLALGLLSHNSGTARAIFNAHHVDTSAVYARIANVVGIERAEPAEVKGYSRWAQTVLQRATDEAVELGHNAVGDGHVLLALLGEREGAVHDAFAATSLTEYGARNYLRTNLASTEPAASAPRSGPGRPLLGGRRRKTVEDKRPNRRGRPVIIIDPARPGGTAAQQLNNNRMLILGIVAVIVLAFVTLMPAPTVFTFFFVLAGWVFSVTLHEFAHALVAYWGGDYTVKDKGYLSFNPLKYTHPMLSIGLPIIFLLMGGIGLPGGAVYIERHRLKNEWWGAAVSAAGPAANLLFAILLALPFATGLVDTDTLNLTLSYNLSKEQLHDRFGGTMDDAELRARFGVPEEDSIWENSTLWSAVALLAMLQITAVFFNLIPIPPLDGSGILEPFLDPKTRFQYLQIGRYGLMIVFFLFWFVDPINNAFWDMVYDITNALGVPSVAASLALFERFLFWRN